MVSFPKRTAWLASVFLIASVNAQTPPWAPAFRYGNDYTFERMSASRDVNDEFDRGQLTLVANVYRPVKDDRRRVVLYSHDSTGGWSVSPKETNGAPPPSIVQFFISRGFTVVAPMRRGVGMSTGTYREECPLSAGQCTSSENTTVSISGLGEAIEDTNAVIDQIILGKLLPQNSKILLAGISRGGFLSLVMAGRRPDLATGVLNFVGGWLGISDVYGVSENVAKMQFQTEQLASAGTKARVPTLWIYAARDVFYSETVSRQFFTTFTNAGGRGDYVFINEHALRNGHAIATQLPIWSTRADQFLAELAPPRTVTR
jgi:dienelactone hydrolase